MTDPAPVYGADCPAPSSPVTPPQFRTDFPAFASQATFPDASVEMWLGIATESLPHWCGCNLYRLGIELYAAHNLVLDAQANAQAAAGGIPTGQVGVVINKAVGPASVGYDPKIGSAGEDAGFWDSTIYGRRFIYLARQFGMGPIQVGAVTWPAQPGRGAGWVGPLPYNRLTIY